MCRYSVIAHSDAITVRDKYAGDIVTVPICSGVQARDLAVSIRNALEHAYNSGIEKGASEQRTYDHDAHGDDRGYLPYETNPVRRGYPQGNTSKQAEIVERWRENNA